VCSSDLIKETIISLLISFVMALVFRSYVVEAFVIPTGSMAPTLLGKHTAHQSDFTGYKWDGNPTFYFDPGQQFPKPIQGGAKNDPLIAATDPMTSSRPNRVRDLTSRPNGLSTTPGSEPLLAGDRILVHKYLYEIFPPERYDVVVFKNPTNPAENYIKRLIGLPNEQVLIAEGDIFARPLNAAGSPEGDGAYTIQRKPSRVMRDLWRPVFSSEYTPRTETGNFSSPWIGEGWSTEPGGRYTNTGPDEIRLDWNSARWPIWDWEPYNETSPSHQGTPKNFPVGDIRLRAGIEPTDEIGRAHV